MESIFGIGIAELIFIAIIALIVLGPERLPGAIRSVTSVIRQIRNLSSELTSQFSEEFKTLEEINPKNLLKELSNDLLGEDEDKNNKAAAAKTGSAKTGVAAAATKSTTRAANTTKPAAATTAPKSPTTPVKKVVTSNGEAKAAAAKAQTAAKIAAPAAHAADEEAGVDKAAGDPVAGDKLSADKQTETVPGEETVEATTGTQGTEVARREKADAGAGDAGAGSAVSPVENAPPEKPARAEEGRTPGKAPSALPGGIGKKNAGAAFTAGSIPKNMGIPARSRKATESAAMPGAVSEDAPSSASTSSAATSAVSDQAPEKAESARAERVNPAGVDKHPGGRVEAGATRADDDATENTILPPAVSSEDEAEKSTVRSKSAAVSPTTAQSSSLHVNGKSGDTQS